MDDIEALKTRVSALEKKAVEEDRKDTRKSRWIFGSLAGLVVIFGVAFGWTFRELKEVQKRHAYETFKMQGDVAKQTANLLDLRFQLQANKIDTERRANSLNKLRDDLDDLSKTTRKETATNYDDITRLRNQISIAERSLQEQKRTLDGLSNQQQTTTVDIRGLEIKLNSVQRRLGSEFK